MANSNFSADDLRNARELLNALRESANIQQKISKDASAYTDYIKKAKDLTKDINFLKKAQEKINNEIIKLGTNLTAQDIARKKQLEAQVKLLKKTIAEHEKEKKLITENLKQANKFSTAIRGASSDIIKLSGGLNTIYKRLAGPELFKMLRSIKTSTLQMGLLGSQANAFSRDVQSAALNTIEYGIGIEDLTKLQSTYSEELGRTVMLGQKGYEVLSQMALATGLGEEASAKFAANMDTIGYSAQRTGEFIEKVIDESSSAGLNTTKVVKNIVGGIKLLNRYNFKNGVEGLSQMAKSAAKVGLDLEFATSMADKLWDVEGAVDLSAQLQVLGGEWAKLADPFKLMYMARNDIEGLTNSLINATKASATFNTKTGEFDISAFELDRLRKVAQATNLDFENLATSAKKAARFSRIRSQIGINVNDDILQFIENTAKLDKNGRATIEIDGKSQYLDTLKDIDEGTLNRIVSQRKSLENRVKDSITLDQKLGNLVTMFKQLALPLVEALNDGLGKDIDKLVKDLKKPETLEAVRKLGTEIGTFVGGIGKFANTAPKLAKSLGSLAALMIALQPAKWYLNGVSLGMGFNRTAALNSVAGTGGLPGGPIGKFGRKRNLTFGKSIGKGLGGGLGGLAAGLLLDTGRNFLDDPNSNLGKSMGIGSTALEWGGAGALIGSAIPGLGTALGGIIGGVIGAGKGAYDEYFKMNDGIVKFNNNDKFMKVDDSTMIAGTNVNGNKDLAKALSNAKAPVFKDTEKIKNTKPVETSNQKSSTLEISFGEIKFSGNIDVTINGEKNTEIGRELLDTPNFIRDLTKIIHQETAKSVSGISQLRVKNT